MSSKKIDCCRCDKEIKKPETNCFCQGCVDKIADWRIINALVDYHFEQWNKNKALVQKLRDGGIKDVINR